MKQWGLVRNGLSVDDLIRDVHSVEGVILLLKRYLEDTNLPHPPDMRERHVMDLMALMREQGRILQSDPRYKPMNYFYQATFGEEFPSWVEEKISRRKYA